MAVYDVGPQRRALLADTATLGLFPAELLHIIRSASESTTATLQTTSPTTSPSSPGPSSFLDGIAQAALLPRLTGPLFAHFEPLFADICARWLLHARRAVQDDAVLAAFARVLPLAPYLSVLLDQYLDETCAGGHWTVQGLSLASPLPPDDDLCRMLLTLWRLVSFDRPTYAPLVPAGLQQLFQHLSSAPVRYLAIRIFCLVHAAADFKMEALQRQFLPDDQTGLMADFDGVDIDYTFLSLYEHARCDAWQARIEKTGEAELDPAADSPSPFLLPLTPLVAAWGRTVVPRPTGTNTSSSSPSSTLVRTATTLANLEALAQRLQRPEPILLRGLPGSGKTALVREAARALGMDTGLVTLHLNEQTDAKTLVGLYAAGAHPGSFAWRPGVLTAAVQEGRWVLIEDLDRAPNEVLSTLLPLIERRELLVPARRETIRARASFRIFATVRTAVGLHGHEITGGRALLGERLWQPLAVRALPAGELEQVVRESFPALGALVPDMLAVFARLTASSAVDRPATLRDLLKWCRRVEHVFGLAGTDATLTDTSLLNIFLDAMDCFAGSAKDERARQALGAQIAQALRLPPAVAEHALDAHEPPLHETEWQLAVGRTSLRKTARKTGSRGARAAVAAQQQPFATTAHARRLLEQIAVGVSLREPLLLVGETGIGKTTVVQQLAASVGRRLVVVNLSQQSEAGDLLGGFKPVSARSLVMPLKEEFEDLFAATGISTERNDKYLRRIATSLTRGRWGDLCRLWQQAPKMFAQIVERLRQEKLQDQNENQQQQQQQPPKRRRTESRLAALIDLQPRWDAFADRLEQFSRQVAHGSGSGDGGAFAFAFVEGKIVQAVRNGDWLLLDEINLASADTLESIADLLSAGMPSLLLSETGDMDRIEAHADFRVFGAMNPATDVGKRDLPLGLRSRFTELYVSSPDRSVRDLVPIVQTYLRHSTTAAAADRVAERVARLYLAIKALAEQRRLVDGAGEVPHYSLRTLTRVLRYVDDVASCYGLERALYEGFCMGFLTLLSQQSEQLVVPLIREHLASDERQLARPPKMPRDGRAYVRFTGAEQSRQYWLLQGEATPRERDDYIRTPSVERNLLNLVRATSTRRFPVLLQGPTSAGKTSMIEFLADLSGNRFVRINNHEHTDLQEYLGTYRADASGRLRFCEGVLVQAMRQGHWLVLDELNLAPTDVLEALNRLLDDNRELLVPETQEVVRPHERFVLFATQNPAGLYGGRKVLSRAFRNRFLELHVDDIPDDELGHILQQRCRNTAPSDCARIVAVYKELSRLRQTTRLFEHKNSFATLRDLFRWALRDADTRGDIAAHGFMLLAERVRDHHERAAVKTVVESVFKTKIVVDALYSPQACPELHHFVSSTSTSSSVVWTRAMRRLFVLVAHALRNHEPVLLVGETGCGKTTVCQLLADAAGRPLHTVNAHQNTETGDLIGSQRPVRNRSAVLTQLQNDLVTACTLVGRPTAAESDLADLLAQYKTFTSDELAQLPADLVARIAHDDARSRALFEWSDGSLVHAMKTGAYFLLDEISLADDSVLERLNSVLEPQRTILLAEKGTSDDPADDLSVVAHEHFQFLATMNPGGDFGKKELSPALRNRFTEIWVPALTTGDGDGDGSPEDPQDPEDDTADVEAIVAATLHEPFRPLTHTMVAFAVWFGRTFRASSATPLSIRDVLVWSQFINRVGQPENPTPALVHGAATVFIDGLGANPAAMASTTTTGDPAAAAAEQRARCLRKLGELLHADAAAVCEAEPVVRTTDDALWAGDFYVARTPTATLDAAFAFDAPTTRRNAMRLVRAMQLPHKPVLLEGSPGVGKTTLVAALAGACGQPLTRINLSDQTDLMDLFGTDVPVEGAEAGRFAWRDAPFLQAMQRGEWVLLDEMNLASQSVLEGLNACLDHRGEVYVAELDQSFRRHPDFRLFAAQNPHHQGGGRKGLPSSFVNRFIVVYADLFSEADQLRIAHRRFPAVPTDTVRHITAFVSALDREVVVRRSLGLLGSPWEFNLRDTLRWLELAAVSAASTASAPLARAADVPDFFDVAIRQRFRSSRDRREVARLFAAAFAVDHRPHSLYHAVGNTTAQAGIALLPRSLVGQPTTPTDLAGRGFDVRPRLAELESLLLCVQHNLPCILVGASGTGKSALLRHVAGLSGKQLVVFSLSADVDAMDLVGGFEQADPVREVYASLADLQETLGLFLLDHAADTQLSEAATVAAALMQSLQQDSTTADNENNENNEATRFAHIADCIARLAPLIEAQSALGAAASCAYDCLRQPLTLAAPRFEWLDSVIVHAAQAGHWLVLDNANLCNASVLDRLNSLLERPNGFLSINEHSGPNGEPRIVALHPDFRVFLTVDPRYGELSRAMRNRSVEIYMDTADGDENAVNTTALVLVHSSRQHVSPVEARMLRFLDLLTHATLSETDAASPENVDASLLWLDNLTLGDSALLPRFFRAVETGGLLPNAAHSPVHAHLLQRIRAVMAFLSSAEAAVLRNAMLQQYTQFAQGVSGYDEVVASDNRLDSSLISEQPLHPAQNALLVQALVPPAATDHSVLPTWLWWLGICYQRMAQLFCAREELQQQQQQAAARLSKLSLLNRLQRASLAGQVAVVARDSTASAFRFLSETLQEMQDCLAASVKMTKRMQRSDDRGKEARLMLHVASHIWWRTYALLTAAPQAGGFDEARFQAHLGHGQALLRQLQPSMQRIHDGAVQEQPDLRDLHEASQSFHAFVSSMLRRLARDFADGFRLTTGLNMDLLWPLLRPMPIPDEAAFRQVTSMERLAARFDNLKWRVSGAASAATLGQVMAALAEAYRLLRIDSTDAAGLVQAVADEIAALEAQAGGTDSDGHPSLAGALPLFADIFEAVRQLHVLYGTGDSQRDDQLLTLVLSDLPTFSQLRLLGSVGVANQLQAVDYLLSQDAAVRPWSGSLSAQLLRKSDHLTASSALSSLRSLENELPLVGRVVSRASASLAADPVAKLGETLLELLSAVGACYDARARASSGDDLASFPPTQFKSLFDDAIAHSQLSAVQISESGLVILQDGEAVPAASVFWPSIDDNSRAFAEDRWLAPLFPVLQQHFLPAIIALAASQHHREILPHKAQSFSAVAWVQFAVGCIKLYTPDKVFDPFLEWQTEQDFHTSLRTLLVQEAAALCRFERDFTGQEGPSLRLSLAEEDIDVLDAAWVSRQAQQPHAQLDSPTRSIYRPTNSGSANELSRLQKDVFNPVLDVTVKDDISAAHYRIVSSLQAHTGAGTATAQQELQLVQNNVVRLIERLLMSQFTAYQDLAVPVANLLRCLQLGLSLSEGASAATPDTSDAPWLSVTPFLGGHLTTIEAVPTPMRRSWEFLLLGGVCASVDGGNSSAGTVTSAFSPERRRHIAECFHFFFDEWNRKLEADRRAEEAKSNLYRFRGSLEDEEAVDEAEFSELFPTYSGNEDNSNNTSAKKALATWDLSADVAKIHRDIFEPSRPATDAILDFCKTIARKTTKDSVAEGASDANSNALLPAALLVVDDKLQSLQSSAATTSTGTYNFYTDTNLPEARKLVALVHDIQTRFRSLQRVDEIGHLQPLADVVLACERVLELEFTAPLARVIPRVEKLHETLYEWQFRGYASRQYLTPTLYDRTTTTLVSWRKLELSTWSRLFDTEADKCRQEAGAWWFIAYQAAIAGPMAILVGGQDGPINSRPDALAYHAEQLLKELSAYLSASIVGQYVARLALLRQIIAHIGLLVDEYPAMTLIRNALQNLVQFYAPYEHKAAETIKKGRDGLQKTMNDVLLLASWRDTNIDALRESARKSHLKLFRLVRKFRAVLGQPMQPIIQQGLPDDSEQEIVRGSQELEDDANALQTAQGIDLARPQAAAKLCAQLIPGWGEDAHTRRLSGVDRIVSIMGNAMAIPASALDASDVVASFVTDLLDTMAELRKETPGLLTEENKDAVKHLKTRKIRLFDDTLKAVRQMGFSTNLGTSRLAAQGSLALILSGSLGQEGMQLPEELDLAGLEYSFHKLLDLAPQFREALHEHHGDLQRVTARRSVGHLEGILFVTLRQRELLTSSARSLTSLDRHIAYFDNISAGLTISDKEPSVDADRIQLETRASDCPHTLRWLLAIARVGMHLIDVHDRLATVDCKSVRTQLMTWTNKLEGLRAMLEAESPVLPGAFVSAATLELRARIGKELESFTSDLSRLSQERPDLTYVLDQIKLWTVTNVSDNTESLSTSAEDSSPKFTEEALNLSKLVLDAVQKFNKAVAELPTSTEDASWLVDYNTKLSSAAKSLHVGTVVSSIEQCIDLLRTNPSTLQSTIGPSLLRLLLPLLQQYVATFRRTLLRLAALHRSTCQLGHRLSRAFVEIASQGFCTPPEKSDESSGQTSGKLEEGTGLGDGEGAEDISKDIQPDEDLSELAQTANKEQQDKGEEIEDEKDAIDMGNDDMEGEMGDAAGEEEEDDGSGNDKDGDNEEDDMDEEAGDVDDLDPTAVDEKMWDGEDAKDTEKEQQGNESKGQKNDDEQVAAADGSESKAPEEAAAGEEGGDTEDDKKAEEEEDAKEDGGDENEADDDAIGSDDEQVGPQQELNRQDQNVDQSDALDLPDDMELDDGEEGDEGEDDDGDDLDDLKDLEAKDEEAVGEDTEMEENRGKADDGDAEEEEEETGLEGGEAAETDEVDNENEDGENEEDDEMGDVDEGGMDVDEDGAPEEESAAPQPPVSDAQAADNKDTAAPNDVQSGVGPDQQEDTSTAQEEQADKNQNNSSAKRDQGEMGQDTDEKDTMAGGDDGMLSNRERNEDAAQPEESAAADQAQQQPFKKLGDVLERWHRNQREIRQADDKTVEHESRQEDSADQAAQQEFQHLHDEEAPASTQAMGAADDDEARPFDDSMAIEEPEDDKVGGKGENGDGEDDDARQQQHANDESNEDAAEADTMQEDVDREDDGAKKTEGDDGRAGASLQRGAYDDVADDMDEDEPTEQVAKEEDEDEDEDEDEQEKEDELLAAQLLSSTHLQDDDSAALLPMDAALRQWSDFQTATHGLSLALAAQLRLILTPSQATRLSGGFRTGKRLSIRKIIPYIASGYKRDKIWMRRSVPTKRAYQILLCVDDSRSMAEVKGETAATPTAGHLAAGSPGHLALSSLVMVARALAMLEAGQVGVLGFGARVFAAHGLLDAEPFGGSVGGGGGSGGSVQGASALRRFTFQQDRTDVAQLLRTTIDTFQQARAATARSAGSGSADLWQLAILLSDGLTPSAAHERIRQLLREAAESRIMVVFVVLDGRHGTSSSLTAASDSVLDLKEAKFVRDPVTGTSRVVIERYLDTFPFPYYLIVHNLADLPSALAGLLRTWFAEVNS